MSPTRRLSGVADIEVNLGRWPSTERGTYIKLFENVAAVIRDGAEQAVKWEESAEVIELIELAYQSAREERTVVVPPRA